MKSKDINSRKKIIIPSGDKEGFYCNTSDEFKATCTSTKVSLSAKIYNTVGYKERASNTIEVYKTIEGANSVEEVKCIENAICYNTVKQSPTAGYKNVLYIFIQGGNDLETFEIEYAINKGKVEDYLDYILDNIKITNDAEYKIGKVEGNQLKLSFKSDDNNNPYATAEMILDANKYHEVENGINNVSTTTVRMATGGNIILSFATNSLYYLENYESYQFYKEDGSIYILSFTPDEGRDSDFKEKIVTNGKTIFKRNYNYSIDVGKNAMINVAYMDGHIERTIEDFTNAKGEILIKQ